MDIKNNKENVSINIQTEVRPGKTTEITAEIPLKGSQQQTESTLSSSSNLDKGLSEMGTHSANKDIPFQELSGIENYNESMQIYFRDAFNLSRIFSLTMALQLKIFEIFMQCCTSNNAFCTVKDIRTKILTNNSLSNITERHLADLLNELGTQGFLESQGTFDSMSYQLSDFTKKYFLQNSPNSIARMYLNLNHYMKSFQENMLSNFSLMGKSLNHAEDNFLDETETNMVMDYFYRTSERSFARLMELVDFSRFKRVADVRGCYGLLAAMLKKRFPTVEFYSFDNPTLENYAVNRLTALNMVNDVFIRSGSVLSGINICDCDCIIAPYLFMHFNNENCLKALKNIYNCLNANGGQLIILENLVDPQLKDCKAITMSFMMGIQNCEGHARTFNEFMALLMSAGFKTADRVQMGSGMSDMIIATR